MGSNKFNITFNGVSLLIKSLYRHIKLTTLMFWLTSITHLFTNFRESPRVYLKANRVKVYVQNMLHHLRGLEFHMNKIQL